MSNIIIAFLISLGYAQEFHILEIRKAYYASFKNYKAAEDFSDVLNRLNKSRNPIIIGYKGMSEFIFSYHSYNPYRKLDHFYKGRELLEQAIQMDAKNTELFFLRFSVQTNCPFFLNYSDKIQEDKKRLITYLLNYKEQDRDLKKRIKDHLLQSKYLKEKEKKEINALK